MYEALPSATDDFPLSIVLDIPTRLQRNGGWMDVPLPILIVVEEGQVVVPRDVYRFACSRASFEKFEALRRMVVAVAALYDHWRKSELSLREPESVDALIWSYLDSRMNGSRPVAFDTVRSDFAYIRLYARFCRKNRDLDSPFSQAFAESSQHFENALPRRPTAEFLQHLQMYRERWMETQETEAVFPEDLRKRANPAVISKKGIVKFPTETQMDDAIDLESNPVYRAALCLLAAQGPRLSELLHMWRCDILPPSYASHFGASNDGNTFIIYAHPEASGWVGTSIAPKAGINRAQVLRSKYGMISRRWLPLKKERSGWKSILLTDPRGLSYGFWMVDRYAKEFASLLPKILILHEECRTDPLHPYYWIHGQKGGRPGEVMRMRSLRRAIGRACARVGLDPFIEDGGHGHGLRHFCKWMAQEKVGLSAPEVQLVMRHADVRSQEDYGRRLSDLRAKLSGRTA